MNKNFDCVGFKREMQTRVQKEIKGMTGNQMNEYLQKKINAGPFRELWNGIQSVSNKKSA
ncbi:MAG: hypothetical protein WCP79_15200 [Bacillota bacterium]